jgi:hypothetical protein
MYYKTTDRGLCYNRGTSISMNPEIDVGTLSISKLKKESDDFEKYDIDVSLDEVENNEDSIKLKYKFTLLSNPTNIKISIDGFASIHGNEMEISRHLQPDQKNVPAVVNYIYQELFPLIYLISKTMYIPCPAYRLADISSRKQPEVDTTKPEENVISSIPSSKSSKLTGNAEPQDESIEPPQEPILDKPVIEQANVSSI